MFFRFRNSRNRYFIHANLALSLGLAETLFLVGISKTANKVNTRYMYKLVLNGLIRPHISTLNARPCQVCSEKSRIFSKLNAVRRLRSVVLSVPEKVSLGPISIPRDRTVLLSLA